MLPPLLVVMNTRFIWYCLTNSLKCDLDNNQKVQADFDVYFVTMSRLQMFSTLA